MQHVLLPPLVPVLVSPPRSLSPELFFLVSLLRWDRLFRQRPPLSVHLYRTLHVPDDFKIKSRSELQGHVACLSRYV